jgi:hypothetical protein
MKKKDFSYRLLKVIRNLVTPEDSTISRQADMNLFSMVQVPAAPLRGFKTVFWILISLAVSFIIAQL